MASTFEKFNINEPVEVRIQQGDRHELVLSAWVTDRGMVAYSLTRRGHGTPEALSNMQSTRTFPGKAISGWQAEVVAFARAGLGTVTEIR